MTIVEFLTARLDEDEAAAREVEADRPRWDDPDDFGDPDSWFPAVRLNARFTPMRVLADVAAKRAILKAHPLTYDSVFADDDDSEVWPGARCQTCHVRGEYCGEWPCPTIGHLAAVYSDHPDYQPEWRP